MGAGCPRTVTGPPVVLLANPVAGGGAAGRIARQVVHTLAGLRVEVLPVYPGSPDEAGAAIAETVAAAEARTGLRPRALVAVGGDGTIRLGAGLAVESGLPLGVVPAGTGNGIAYSLGLPLDPWEACRVVARGTPEPCDLGRLVFTGGPGDGSTLFINVAGAGLDAVVARTYRDGGVGGRGGPGYALAVLHSLATYRPVALRLTVDGEPLATEALLVAVGNGGFYGKGVRVAPSASPADGLLDVLIVLPLGLGELSGLLPLFLLGRHESHPRVRTLRVREVVIEADPGEPRDVPVHADGDVVWSLPVRVSVVPGAVRVILDRRRFPAPGTGESKLQVCER